MLVVRLGSRACALHARSRTWLRIAVSHPFRVPFGPPAPMLQIICRLSPSAALSLDLLHSHCCILAPKGKQTIEHQTPKTSRKHPVFPNAACKALIVWRQQLNQVPGMRWLIANGPKTDVGDLGWGSVGSSMNISLVHFQRAPRSALSRSASSDAV